jgi:hypothetical protein
LGVRQLRDATTVFDDDAGESRTLSLFPEDRCEAVDDANLVKLRLNAMTLHRPRQFLGMVGGIISESASVPPPAPAGA